MSEYNSMECVVGFEMHYYDTIVRVFLNVVFLEGKMNIVWWCVFIKLVKAAMHIHQTVPYVDKKTTSVH